MDISIHAPARGATGRHFSAIFRLQHFNPRSREGSDEHQTACFRDSDQFQSTLPRGERRCSQGRAYSAFRISIHAPARGATSQAAIKDLIDIDFNPRSREGSDRKDSLSDNSLNIFQSTLPRGERLKSYQKIQNKKIFQSTLPRGERRFSDTFIGISVAISIHAPARGATVNLLRCILCPAMISIHAPARGATGFEKTFKDNFHISIHAPARGATSLYIVSSATAAQFQSTLPRGERREK